jgi:predicted acetyltransferase
VVEVRAIEADEMAAWVDAMHLGFHVQRPAEPDAQFRNKVLEQDLARTLAAVDGEHLVGTLFSFPAELTLPGGASLVADAISAVTVSPTHRRRGLLTRMVQQDLCTARERGEAASILLPAEYPIYGRFGFGPATDNARYTLRQQAATFKRAARGSVELLEPQQMLDQAPQLFDRFRTTRPGQIDRPPINWEMRLGVREAPWQSEDKPPRCGLYTNPAGEPEGYLLYKVEGRFERHVPSGKMSISELIALTPDAYLGLWRYACAVDLVREITAEMRPVDEPLGWLLENARAALEQSLRTDFLWLRPLDVPATLGARRYLASGRVVLEVDDPLALCGGRFALEGGPDGALCRATDESADLHMDMSALGAISLGGTTLRQLFEVGAIDELRPGAVHAADRLFDWPQAPWCSTFF